MPFMRFRPRRGNTSGRVSYKHVVDITTKAVNGGTLRTARIAIGVDNPALAGADNVSAQCRIRKIYCDLEFSQEAAAPMVSFRWYIVKDVQNILTLATPGLEGVSAIKPYIFKSGMEMVGVSSHRKVVGWVKIPRKYQTFMNTDALYLVWYSDAGAGLEDTCMKFIYKEER